MKVTLLGTGTSQGVPVIGCDCEVCTSTDARDHRLRCSLWISDGASSIVIDAGPDFRQQMLRAKVPHLDALLLTHEHNDHVAGMDDVRPFNFKQGGRLPVYGLERVLDCIKSRYSYAFGPDPYPGAPRFDLIYCAANQDIAVGNTLIQPLDVMHGSLPILGYRVKNMAYLTDVKTLPDKTKAMLMGLDVLIISALHYNEHPTHLNLQEAIALIQLLDPKRAYIIHCSHKMGLYREVQTQLPPKVFLAHDNLTFEL